MTTFITIKPHYCDLRYGEAVSDSIFYMKSFGIPRRIPVFSNLLLGYLNSLRLPKDDVYFPEGPFEVYPLYYKKPDAKIISTLKDNTIFNLQFMPKSKRNFIIKILSVCDAFIVDTEYMKSLVGKYFEKEIKVHPPFCAQPFFDVKPDLESKNILFIGDNNLQKGFLQLVGAMDILQGWDLHLIGRCGSVVKNAPKNVHIENYQKNLGPYFSKCAFYVHPASFDVFGVAILEAMSAGLIPVVASMTGVSEVLIKNGLKDLVISDNKPETIKNKLEKLNDWSHKKKVSVSSKCRRIVKEKFTEDINVRDFKKIFNSLL